MCDADPFEIDFTNQETSKGNEELDFSSGLAQLDNEGEFAFAEANEAFEMTENANQESFFDQNASNSENPTAFAFPLNDDDALEMEGGFSFSANDDFAPPVPELYSFNNEESVDFNQGVAETDYFVNPHGDNHSEVSPKVDPPIDPADELKRTWMKEYYARIDAIDAKEDEDNRILEEEARNWLEKTNAERNRIVDERNKQILADDDFKTVNGVDPNSWKAIIQMCDIFSSKRRQNDTSRFREVLLSIDSSGV